jgi:RNA 3'-terminal phosphate cyclase (ATP)
MLIRIDGRLGEGGGQILRTSLSLSLVTGKAFRIENIRAGREKPGLLRQHLAAVLAAAEVCGGEVEGAVPGSSCLTFRPGPVRPGQYRFSVGTAGSATLVFQTVLPALMLGSWPSSVEVEGGTHNMAAPPYDFLSRTFVPLVNRMGPNVSLRFERYGFYPAGGGRFSAEIQPAVALKPLHLGERGGRGSGIYGVEGGRLRTSGGPVAASDGAGGRRVVYRSQGERACPNQHGGDRAVSSDPFRDARAGRIHAN